jgi:hypothetical protein
MKREGIDVPTGLLGHTLPRCWAEPFTGFEVVLRRWRSIVAGPGLNIEPKRCDGALTPTQIQALEEAIELRLYTCAVCGKRNLYPIKTSSGKWQLEPHSVPRPRSQKD